MNDIKVMNHAADNIRILAASMVEKANSGHPGGAMGGSDFINVLFSEYLVYDPADPTWTGRDRFFLDPGHMSPMLYAFLLAGGTKGKRMALPNAEIMIHQPSGGAQGQATEIEIAAEHILKTKKKLNTILAANTGQPIEVIAADTERDNYMSSEEAKAYGLIDMVIEHR